MDNINRFLEAFLRLNFCFDFSLLYLKTKLHDIGVWFISLSGSCILAGNARYRATAISLVCYPSIILNLAHRQASMIVNAPVLNFPLFKYLSSPGHLTKKWIISRAGSPLLMLKDINIAFY